MATFALRDVRYHLLLPGTLLVLLLAGAAGPAARAQVRESEPEARPIESGAETEKQTTTIERDSSDPFAAPAEKSAPAPLVSKPRGRREANDCSAQSEARIRIALHEPTTMEFTDTPLQDMVDYLKELHGIEIQLDIKALADAGVAPDMAVTRNLKGISLDSALRLTLRDLELMTVVTDGVLLITTPPAASQMVEVRIYGVGDLANASGDMEQLARLFQTLLTASSASAASNPVAAGAASARSAVSANPSPAEPVGSAVQILTFQKLLVVRAPLAEHEELSRVLAELRDTLKTTK